MNSANLLVVVHHHPGRIRARADLLRDAGSGERVAVALRARTAVLAVRHNASTGSILVEYDAHQTEASELLALIVAVAGLKGVIDEQALRRMRPSPAERAIDAVHAANETTHQVSGYRVDLRSMVPVALAGVAAYAFILQEGERLPKWDSLLYWSYQVFTSLHKNEIERHSDRQATGPRRDGVV